MSDEIKQLKDQIQGLVHQLDATKQMLNEQLASSLQFRAHILMFQKANQDSVIENGKLKADLDKLHAENASLLARVTELDAKVSEATKLSVEETIPVVNG